MTLDNQDRLLLRALQKDARISNQELSERVSMSPSACWRKTKALEKSGIIRRYSAVLDAKKSGLKFDAIVQISIERHRSGDFEEFLTAVRLREEILECLVTTGKADFHLRILCRDIEHYNDFLDTFLFKIPGISVVQTNVVLNELKNESITII